eukprot:gene9072-11111_t
MPVYPLHYEYIDRTHIPHPRRFIDGYHFGSACPHKRSGRLVREHHHRDHKYTLENYYRYKQPGRYTNQLYDFPRDIKLGFHEREYLLPGEAFHTHYYEKPYFIERVNRHHHVTRHDLCRANVDRAITMSHIFDPDHSYHYYNDPVYLNNQIQNEREVQIQLTKDAYLADKKVREKSALNRDIARQQQLDKLEQKYEEPVIPPPVERPIYKEETVYIPVENFQVIEPTIKYEQVFSSGTRGDGKYDTPTRMQMASASGGGGLSSSGSTTVYSLSQPQQQESKQMFREEKIIKKSMDGGVTWVSDASAMNNLPKDFKYVDASGKMVHPQFVQQ